MTEPRSRKRRFLCQSAIAFCLLLVCVVYVTRMAQLGGGGVLIDVADEHPASLSPETQALIERSAPRRLQFTFFVSAKSSMPSHLKGVEDHVRRLLDALRDAAPKRIDYRIIDPQISGGGGIGYAARKKISPVSVRGVTQDEHSESRVWSSLVISYEGHPDLYLQDIQTRDLPRLEDWIRARLIQAERPRQPTFALSAPAGFDEFPRYLSQHGPVVEIDLDRGPGVPGDVDVLFWIEPERVSESHIRSLKRFLASGRTVILAGSSYGIDYLADADAPGGMSYRIQMRSGAWEKLLRPFGLKPIPDLLMDRNTGPALVVLSDGSSRSVDSAFHLRNLPAFRDFRRLRTPARGGLCFAAASPLQVDPLRVAQASFRADVAATTTEHAWVRPLPEGRFADGDLAPTLNVPKQNLMVLLSPRDPWSGRLLVLASAAPFRNGIISQSGYGHAVFVNDLVRSFASADALVRLQAAPEGRDPLRPTSLGERLLWRGFTVFAIPVLFLVVGLWRYRRAPNRLVLLDGGRWQTWLKCGGGALALALLSATGLLSRWDRLGFDLTRNRVNTPAASLQERLERERDTTQIDLVLSPRSRLPPALRIVERRTRTVLATAGVHAGTVHPEELSAPERQRLIDSGLQPFEVQRVQRDTAVAARVWSGLRLRRGDHSAVIRRLDERTIAHLDFLLTGAIERLAAGDGGPRVAVVSDLPRLSPAEALEDYQKKGLSAPRGVDVYSRLKVLLGDYGYRVHHVNPRDPTLPADVEAVLWLQPRRDSGEIILQLSEYLARGGTAIVAMQHFNIQQRQYRGIGFQTVYWPQPQFQDFDRYLRLIGVEQVREVLMDRTRHHLALDTQVNRTAVREYDAQEVALPFLIRSVSPFYSRTSPITRSLGDLLFIWGNRFELQARALQEHGYRVETLITTSDRAWSYAWQGGFLPEDVLSAEAFLSGPQPLALLLNGPFPAVEFVEEDGRQRLAAKSAPPSQPPGSLLLVGSSEMLKNEYLHTAGFQHDQFLLNALALTVHGTEMAELQARHRQPPGFAYHRPAAKLWWRLIVTAGGPLILVASLLLWRAWRRTGRGMAGRHGMAAP